MKNSDDTRGNSEVVDDLNLPISDRACAIVGGATVERALEQYLERRLVYDPKLVQKLLEPAQALGAFSTKIRLGWLTGSYSERLYKDLLAIKDIRNKFAHDLDVTSFDDPYIASKTTGLTTFTGFARVASGMTANEDTSRLRFISAVMGFQLHLRARPPRLVAPSDGERS